MNEPQEIVEAMKQYALLLNTISKHAADIAHARRVLYQAYLAEGFSEPQALELCKQLALQ